MTLPLEDRDRNVIPRWRDFRTTVLLRELSGVEHRDFEFPGTAQSLRSKRSAWLANQSPAFATDLLGAAMVLGKGAEAEDAAEFLRAAEGASVATREIAAALLGRQPEVMGELALTSIPDPGWRALGAGVRNSKRKVWRDLRNPIAWTDLALAYATLGLVRRSVEMMERALILAPNNRFVLRSAARLFVHVDDLERAHNVLRDSDRVRSDPWLLAAEIAAANAAGRRSRLLKAGKQLVEAGNLPAFHLGELASAVATVELTSGATKSARKLFRTALREPTENSVAQAGWASRRMTGLELTNRELDVARSYEARAWSAYGGANWELACAEAAKWLTDQPFSSRPAIFGSYIAGVAMDDQPLSEAIARRGLIANPDDFNVLNNLAVALALQDQPIEAEDVFKRIDAAQLTKGEEVVWQATAGLLAFRRNEPDLGERLYRESIAKATIISSRRYESTARAFLAGELLRSGRKEWRAEAADAEAAVETLQEPEKSLLRAIIGRSRKLASTGDRRISPHPVG